MLEKGYEPPVFKGNRRTEYKPEKRQIALTFLGLPDKMCTEDFNREVLTHWRGGMARQALRGME